MTEPISQKPVELTVSDVRQEIYRASEFASAGGERSVQILGSLFHRVFGAIMNPESPCGWVNVLEPERLNDPERLLAEVYAQQVGPWLVQNQGSLSGLSSEVFTMWEAIGHLCRQVCQLLTNIYERKLIRYDAQQHDWRGAEQFATERKLSWLLEDPNWTAPVLVTGVADAVWHNPAVKRWGVLELKLGSGSTEADLAQLCLYHEMLCAAHERNGSQLMLWHFTPQFERKQFSSHEVEPVREKLRSLIGRMAGVSEGRKPHLANEQYKELGVRLVKVLEQFGPIVTLASDPVVGPTFLRFHMKPGPGVKGKKILSLGQDIQLQLGLRDPVLVSSEKGALVIDLQRPDRETLRFSEFRRELPRDHAGNARVLVGADLQRRPHFVDLALECPHVLAAGTAGSGKSEWLRMALASLLDTNTPNSLRIMLIDPKRVTFGEMKGSPFLLESDPATDGGLLYTSDEALSGLQRLIELMEERYQAFAKYGVTDLAALTKLRGQMFPRIVCFCDEYGNLVAQKKPREAIEGSINQLGAKARAAGIHLIVATQDARAQIVSPILKSNLGGRVCLRTTSAIQSRIVLEENGAESLLGHGDLLFKTIGDPVRLQAPLLEDAVRSEIYSPHAGR